MKSVSTVLVGILVMASTTQAENQSLTKQCKVLDPDIAANYVGECKDNYANGYGFASGRDEYRGDFKNGLMHGFGTYSWGEKSKWATEEYRGWYYKGKKMGFGVMTISSISQHPALESMKLSGTVSHGKYYYSGLFKAGQAIRDCVSEATCLEELTIYHFDELDDFLADKKNAISLPDLKRLTFSAINTQSGFLPTIKQCITDELIANSFEQIEDILPMDTGRVAQYQRSLRTKRLITQVSLYCLP